MALLYFNSAQNTLVNWIIRLLLLLLCWPKVILLRGEYCCSKKTGRGVVGSRNADLYSIEIEKSENLCEVI